MKKSTQENGRQLPSQKKKITSRQVVAMIGIALLVLMYLLTLLSAIANNPASDRLFFLSLFSTLTIPVLIWIYTWMYGKLTGKHTFADFDLGGAGKEVSDASETSPDSASENTAEP